MQLVQTPNKTMRLWLHRDEKPTLNTALFALNRALDAFSIWGGADKDDDGYTSWEFPIWVTEEYISVVLTRLGCNLSGE